MEVLSASVDSQFVHKIWDENELSKMTEGGVPFPMLADAAGRLGTAYGVYDDEAGVDVRGRFIIDPDGVIPVSYTHLRAHETVLDLVCRLLLGKKHTHV